ncbi:MAG: GNAT family N-acetyltransferase [Cyanobacteria bacterium REEB459]|nr:GNAT family N-acetyltransferase [Cyanobacteria bacterium REEB459]
MVPGASPPRIRSARLEDLPCLARLLADSFYDPEDWPGFFYPLLTFGIQTDLRQRLQYQSQTCRCLTAILSSPPWSGELAGSVEISRRLSWPWQVFPKTYAYVANLAVGRFCRRRGIASHLLKACEAISLDWQIYDLYLHVMADNRGALRLYQGLGFKIIAMTSTAFPWGQGRPERLLMYKKLKHI